MIHIRDVINSSINESVQKTFAGDHFEMVHKTWILIVFLGSLHLRAEVQRMSFHRTLSEGQEIARRSKFFARDHFKCFDQNSSFLGSYHSTWSYSEVQTSFDVYRLMSHVVWPSTFFNNLLLWKFFEEFTEYALVVPQIEAFVTLILNMSFSLTNNWIGSSVKNPNLLVKMVIFEVIIKTRSCDTSFWSWWFTDCNKQIFQLQKISWSPEIAKLKFGENFFDDVIVTGSHRRRFQTCQKA